MWTKMMVVATWGVWVVHAEGRGLTWAEVMGATPNKISQHASSFPPNSVNNIARDNDYDSFFTNSDYEYVDTDDANYMPPEPQQTEKTSQAAERRTLDLLFHTFMESNKPRHGSDGRPARGATPRRPTLIEAVFKTIDDHILEDLQEWSKYMNQPDPKATTTQPASVAQSAIQQASPINDELLLVTDEHGQQRIVTINDIVTSLGHLDEKTLTDLLLPPEQAIAAASTNRRILSPLPPSVLPRTDPVLPQAQPNLSSTAPSNSLGVQRPVRQTSSVATTTDSEEEVYMVQDEHGIVHTVTFNDILASLAQLSSDSVNDLLFGQAVGAPSPTSSTPILATNPVPSPPPDVTSTPAKNHASKANSKPSAPTEHSASQQTDGPLVHTDEKGNIHITPKPGQPLNIQNIISLAEQGAQPLAADVLPRRNTNSLIQVNEKKQQNSHRGQEVLSFLAGSGDARLPTTVQHVVPPTTASNFRQSLMQALQKRSPANHGVQPIAQYLTSKSVAQPIFQSLVQPTVQPVTEAPSGGLGATLSGLFSRLIGYPEAQQVTQPPPQPAPIETDPQFINLVVQQQRRNINNDVFGAVTIPLPKPIHYQQQKHEQLPSSFQNHAKAAARENSESLPSILHNLSPTVKETLRRQLNNEPKFIPPTSQQQELPVAAARMDTGPVNTFDTRPGNKFAVEEKELRSTAAVPNIPPSLLTNLPTPMLQRLRKQLLEERLKTIQNNHKSTPLETPNPPVDHTRPLERSSYGETPHESYVDTHKHGGYDHYSYEYVTEKKPLLDIFLLADMTKVHKVGKNNLSIKIPTIGDSSKFVDTHSHYGYHH
ncbi:uncharacterized protein [Procambarus clarkii]|uniref:uncharacterized protein n=1 Tax=Procambarus clarkii TaxID=6728 RepID=UPI00374487D8